MIQELKIKNFLSFKDEVVFSFEATSDTFNEKYYTTEVAPGVRLLKLCMVYGANASGKSNLIKSFQFIKNLIKRTNVDKNEGTSFLPFLLTDQEEESGLFELTFYANNTKFVYAVELDFDKIISEKLSFYPGTQPALLFNRSHNNTTDLSEVSYGSKVKINKAVKDEIIAKTLKNISFFAGYSQVNYTEPEIEKAYNWLKDQFLNTIDPNVKLTKYTNGKVLGNADIKKFAINFLQKAQYNITDIEIETESEEVPEPLMMALEKSNIPQSEKDKIIKNGIQKHHADFEHTVKNNGKEEKHFLPEELQSAGTLRYYGFTAPLYRAFTNNAFLGIDEIDSSLHPHLTKHFIREYLMGCVDYPNVQLLLTTHNMSLLNEKDLIRKDAVWFTEKLENGATDLYSMADFDIRKELSYFKAYNSGKFGAIPNID
ncbi:AAA family ATPase [Marinifilum sp. D737]|uniref:AAA family ATPase n=1 Tax=Marinifilum sp. D737 TaxID=2969628 RepID=UPI0022743760|nr:ATP-binding protein [Marinifilum sp. D737]MCY1633917.1 ATP-binding protein [Marinifilum sp. D737]